MATFRSIVAWLLELKEKIERWKRRNERECNYELPVVWAIPPIPAACRVASRTWLLQELAAKSLLEYAAPSWMYDQLIKDLPKHKGSEPCQ